MNPKPPVETAAAETVGANQSGSTSQGPDAAPARDLYDFLAPPQQPDELGRLGNYRILKVLGSGGMGVVFQAEDTVLQRHVAIKAMKPALAASSSARDRFLREARLTASLTHDHIVAVYAVEQDCGVPYLAMPLLTGESLDDRLARIGKLVRWRKWGCASAPRSPTDWPPPTKKD